MIQLWLSTLKIRPTISVIVLRIYHQAVDRDIYPIVFSTIMGH